jgi:hypothetical protein
VVLLERMRSTDQIIDGVIEIAVNGAFPNATRVSPLHDRDQIRGKY